ncbi:MAG: TetR/AcrR family transcriptional regulator C-terminal domain-containing protein [Caldilineaceae bacterium]|nr:TetR/AcrR family transcriptional regulator C-terminal domain-containing protein [Caldilineaceae bacterium]
MNENDLRVQRTRNLLQGALIDLMADKAYEDISVRDLTQHAQVGYRTFFHHYESKDALLQVIVDDALEQFRQARLDPGADSVPATNTLAALHYAEGHADVFRLLLRSSSAETLVAATFDFGLEEGKLFFGESDVPADLVAHYFASSIVGLIRWWLEHDMPFSAEEMAGYINRLVIHPIQALAQDG